MDKKQGWVRLTPETLAALYSPYKITSMTLNGESILPKRVVIDELMNALEDLRHDYIEQAVEKSELRDAKEVIAYIKSK
jgi:hypothetical protein